MTINELELQLTEEDIRPMKIVTIALIVGAVLFAAVGFYLYLFKTTGQDPNYDNSFIDKLLIVLIVVFTGTLVGSRIASKTALTRENGLGSEKAQNNTLDKTELIGIFNTQHIIKLSMIEGSALLGGVVFLLSTLGNQIYATSYNWLSLFPIAFIIFTILYLCPQKIR